MSREESQSQASARNKLDQLAVETSRALGATPSSATRRAGQFKCVGAIRKAGFLSVKKWILKRRQSIELARKQGWKRYWVCLRGTALLFHSVVERPELESGAGSERKQRPDDTEELPPEASEHTDLLSWIHANCAGQVELVTSLLRSESRRAPDDRELAQEDFLHGMSKCYIEKEPRHLIIIEGAIAQPIPEHPKRDYVFCLSTTFGDAYLFQASCQLESDNWIAAIHNACAASIARDLTRDEAIKLFAAKLRHLEVEAEKKLFLRQRLESRLTSMSSMSHINLNASLQPATGEQQQQPAKAGAKITMRSLLYRLSQQLMALDAYIEQIHCEIYQIRCYVSSCGAQQVFYQSQGISPSPSLQAIDLPHPKSLLMHVSKSTKLLLIKMGVFTVSSFHAYIHARQESADSFVAKIQQQQQTQPHDQDTQVELRVRSHSVSDPLLNAVHSSELEKSTEKLIQLSDLRAVSIRLTKKLFSRIRCCDFADGEQPPPPIDVYAHDSDDRYSIHEAEGVDEVLVNLKLLSNSDSTSIIKQVLNIIKPNSGRFDFLQYYLQFAVAEQPSDGRRESSARSAAGDSNLQYVAKRKETLSDWNNCEQLELVEKIIFRVELTRRRIDEESAPFGISAEAQLVTNDIESQLSVFCSYIEWGSVADKSGLRDDDELLVINGVPVADLDMMFVECLIQDSSKLSLVVRSGRSVSPSGSTLLDKLTWGPADEDGSNSEGNLPGLRGTSTGGDSQLRGPQSAANGGSHVISDEYISSLVCPPPPTQSSAFLRTDSSFLRQKSDLISGRGKQQQHQDCVSDYADAPGLQPATGSLAAPRAKSQLNLDFEPSESDQICSTDLNRDLDLELVPGVNEESQETKRRPISSAELASELLKKSEQLTQLLGKSHRDSISEVTAHEADGPATLDFAASESQQQESTQDPNALERLRKSILELLETEYAYIKHLETIREHYMSPLEEMAFLSISQLRQLNQVILKLLCIQRDFFGHLMLAIYKAYQIDAQELGDEFKELNTIVQRLDLFRNYTDFKPILQAVASTFMSEADELKPYVAYCVAYSKLQRLLHPKRNLHGSSLSASTISLMPSTLNTFQTSNSQSVVTTGSGAGVSVGGYQHRDFLKPLGSLMPSGTDHQTAQLKLLGEFLGNLDSSSSSASLSLMKSSSPDQSSNQKTNAGASAKQAAFASSSSGSFQKSVHQQNFESYLIKPIQRIVKYPMLLNSISMSASHLNQSDDSTIGDLQCAVRQMEAVVSHVNDAQCLHDEYGSIFEIIERQYFEQQTESASKSNSPSPLFGPHQPPISLDIEHLLYHNPVDWLNTNEFTSKLKKGICLTQLLFVFNSCVVFICKELVRTIKKKTPIGNIGTSGSFSNSSSANQAAKSNQRSAHNEPNSQEVIRYQCLIPVSEVQVRSVPNSGNQSDKFKWELFQCSSSNSNSSLLAKSTKRSNTSGKVFLLASPSNEIRNIFLRKIRLIIRESVRNMSLPLARSPSGKSSTSKKLSSPSSGTNTNSSCSHSTSLSPVYNKNNNCKDIHRQIKTKGDCNFAGQVDNNYKSGIEVNN